MRKRVFLFLTIIGLALIVSSCQQENDLPANIESQEEAIVLRAKDYLEFELGPPVLPDVYYRANATESRSDDWTRAMLSDCLQPDWSQAVTKIKDDRNITGVPMRLIRPIVYAVRVVENGETISYRIESPAVRLVIHEKTDGQKHGFLISYLPDEGEMDKMSGNMLSTVDAKFTGIAIYSLSDGTPEFGLRYKNGSIAYWLHFNANAEIEEEELLVYIGSKVDGMTTKGVDDDNEIPEVVVIGGRKPKPEKGPYPWEEDRESPDEGGGGGGSSTGGNQKKITVTVANNHCVPGTIAAALQAKFGYSNTEALNKAYAALKAIGKNFDLVPAVGTGGIEVGQEDIEKVLTSLGFTANVTVSSWATHFNNGGLGIWHNDSGSGLSHDVLVIGYNSNSGDFTWYDSVTGKQETGNLLQFFPSNDDM